MLWFLLKTLSVLYKLQGFSWLVELLVSTSLVPLLPASFLKWSDKMVFIFMNHTEHAAIGSIFKEYQEKIHFAMFRHIDTQSDGLHGGTGPWQDWIQYVTPRGENLKQLLSQHCLTLHMLEIPYRLRHYALRQKQLSSTPASCSEWVKVYTMKVYAVLWNAGKSTIRHSQGTEVDALHHCL